MKIKIDNIENKKYYIDETYYIMSNYRFLYKRPNRKIRKKTTSLIYFFAFILLYLLAVSYLAIVDKSFIYYICIGISIVCIAFSISKYIVVKKNIDMYSNTKTNSDLEIDENKVVLHNNVIKQEITINWEDIDKILVSENCIVFMERIKKNAPYTAITIPRTIEEKVIKALEKYNKKELLIYNKKNM